MMRHLVAQSEKPVTKRVGPRRVRTEPVQGQLEEPDAPVESKDNDVNRDRLTKDKPPHY